MLDLSLKNLEKALLVSEGLSDSEIVKLIDELNIGFTKSRDTSLKKYHLDKYLVSAYCLFYLPSNLPKFHFLMEQIPGPILNQLRTMPFIDVGTGPGTFLLAYLDYFKQGKVFGVEQSETMRSQAKKVLDYYFPEQALSISNSLPAELKDSFLFFGHSLNEMGSDVAFNMVQKMNPKAVALIEPGTTDSFEKVLEFRTRMLEQGFNVIYPCSSPAPCPLEKGDWCHQVLRYKGDDSFERLSQLAKRDRRSLPMIAHFYWKGEESNKSFERVVRFLRETKHSFIYQVCGAGNVLKKIEVEKKSIPKNIQKALSKEPIGLEIKYEVLKVNTESTRARLIQYGPFQID